MKEDQVKLMQRFLFSLEVLAVAGVECAFPFVVVNLEVPLGRLKVISIEPAVDT